MFAARPAAARQCGTHGFLPDTDVGNRIMSTSAKQERARALSSTPWGLLPPRMRVLYVTSASRTGAWLAEAFASDSACDVTLQEAHGTSAGVEHLRDQVFDAVLVSHEPGQLDALSFVDGLRAGGAEEPLLIAGQPSESEMAALCYEVGADAYVCTNTTTTRTLLWTVARAVERHHLIRENRRLQQAERHRLQQEQQEATRMLTEQRGLLGQRHGACGTDPNTDAHEAASSANSASAALDVDAVGLSQLDAAVHAHYREMLRAHVMMGSGKLPSEMSALAETLASSGVTAPQTMQLHVQALEELVQGLGNRSARHVMTRADLLLVDLLVHLAEQYRQRVGNPRDLNVTADSSSQSAQRHCGG